MEGYSKLTITNHRHVHQNIMPTNADKLKHKTMI